MKPLTSHSFFFTYIPPPSLDVLHVPVSFSPFTQPTCQHSKLSFISSFKACLSHRPSWLSAQDVCSLSSHGTFCILLFFFFKDFIYLFLERGEGREKERERNINVWLLLHTPHWGPGPQPRHVPWLWIELATLWFRLVLKPLRHTSQGLLYTSDTHHITPGIKFNEYQSLLLIY